MAQQRTVVLSLEAFDDLNSTATEALAEFVSALKQQEGRLVLAWVKDRASESLMRARLIADQDALASVHWSFDDAVHATRAK